jgi:recombination protein U
MKAFEEQEGLAFFLISYTLEDFYYYLPLRHFLPFWERAQAGGRKSFRMDELDMNWVLPKKPGVLVPYLEMINRDLAERESDRE